MLMKTASLRPLHISCNHMQRGCPLDAIIANRPITLLFLHFYRSRGLVSNAAPTLLVRLL